ncbi:divergent polysaccharide deacetylase family protein [Marinomonas atlantica]|uniref:divergent polysaccharide deacetylase family protein n=1 Tax=Marinomonas atlantica TaxID=1806668 RepID=UPI0009ED86BA|nr:divergent polysaccharide deacetylase family protein [Marinomonas atlantica]MCO4786684.1 divergent polysaccharide deacetylase family protein [Marinomonas atlantica]
MRQLLSNWVLASAIFSCVSSVLYADEAADPATVPFPVLDRGVPKSMGQFPYLVPLTNQKSDWPPLFKTPKTLPNETPKSKTSLEISAMDALPAPPKIAVVIDDVGYNRRGMEESLALPLPVVLAILPETPYGARTAQRAHLQERITILHAPMENERELKLGPGGLYVNMDEQTFKQTLYDDLDSTPYVTGVNNHMGSLLTTHSEHMGWVMDIMAERSLFFIDSLTSPKSVAYKTAVERGVRTVTRDIFLDNVRSEEAISKQFERLLKRAHKQGSAIAIGHPYPETTRFLKRRLNQPLSAQLVTIDTLLQ